MHGMHGIHANSMGGQPSLGVVGGCADIRGGIGGGGGMMEMGGEGASNFGGASMMHGMHGMQGLNGSMNPSMHNQVWGGVGNSAFMGADVFGGMGGEMVGNMAHTHTLGPQNACGIAAVGGWGEGMHNGGQQHQVAMHMGMQNMAMGMGHGMGHQSLMQQQQCPMPFGQQYGMLGMMQVYVCVSHLQVRRQKIPL